ncbi:hypothetical protein O9992_27540 [Vibrio lentus]|nr:hypothetical protein [Vibrio lentus]
MGCRLVASSPQEAKRIQQEGGIAAVTWYSSWRNSSGCSTSNTTSKD